MRTLTLLRHAKSSWADPGMDDHDRPLNARGLENCRRLARHLEESGVAPDLVLCSTAERARATLHGVFPGLRPPLDVRYDPRLYLAEPETLLDLIRAVPDRVGHVMVVGHNPGLEELAALLAGSGPEALLARMQEKFPTGALAVIDFDVEAWREVAPRAGRLRLFAVPRELAD